jgi:hypothetical protein
MKQANAHLMTEEQLFKVHKEKSNKIKQCIKILLFHIYM